MCVCKRKMPTVNDDPKPNGDMVIFQQWLDIQRLNIEQQARETERLRESERNHFEFAKQALKSQAADSEGDRVHQRKQSGINKLFAAIILVVSLGFILFLVTSGHTAVAYKILEVVVPLAGGGFGGYAIGYRQAQKQFQPGPV